MRTYSETYRNERDTRYITNQLFTRSQWFSVTPLPDGEFEVSVKEENRGMLHNMREGSES